MITTRISLKSFLNFVLEHFRDGTAQLQGILQEKPFHARRSGLAAAYCSPFSDVRPVIGHLSHLQGYPETMAIGGRTG